VGEPARWQYDEIGQLKEAEATERGFNAAISQSERQLEEHFKGV
jgi:hypothetical protein